VVPPKYELANVDNWVDEVAPFKREAYYVWGALFY